MVSTTTTSKPAKGMSIVDLMQVPRANQDVEWLKQMLQYAVDLEVSTLPPYLSGLWTIQQGSGPVYDLIQSVIQDDMVYLVLACNMFSAIEATSTIYELYHTNDYHYPYTY